MLSELELASEEETTTKDLNEARSLLETSFRTTYHSTSLENLEVCADGHIEFEGTRIRYTQSFLEAVPGTFGMGLPYAHRIDFGLFKYNFEQRKRVSTKAVTICVNHNVAVSLADAEYHPPRTLEILDSLTANQEIWKFREAHLSDRGVELNFAHPGKPAEPQPGDLVELGIRISNSETGFSWLKASMFALRLVCSNGAVLGSSLGEARWNYDRRVTHGSSIRKFLKDLRKLEDGQKDAGNLYDGITERFLLDTELVHLWRRLRTDLDADTSDAVLGVPTEDRQAAQAAVRLRTQNQAPQPTRWHVWDVHNSITAAAQRRPFRQRTRLERLGGTLLSLSPQN